MDSVDYEETRPTRYHVLFTRKAKGVFPGRHEADIHPDGKNYTSKEKEIDMGFENVLENGHQHQPTRKKLI